MNRNTKGFSLVEIMVAVTIVTILMGIFIVSISAMRSRARDAQVRTDKQNLILALVRAREASPTFTYPGVAGWQCIKPSGQCWINSYTGNQAIVNAIRPYMPGGVIPMPPSTITTQRRTGGYTFTPYIFYPSQNISGAFLAWSQEKPIPNADCPGWNIGRLDTQWPNIYYCLEMLPK